MNSGGAALAAAEQYGYQPHPDEHYTAVDLAKFDRWVAKGRAFRAISDSCLQLRFAYRVFRGCRFVRPESVF